jgi:hypothetical protein
MSLLSRPTTAIGGIDSFGRTRTPQKHSDRSTASHDFVDDAETVELLKNKRHSAFPARSFAIFLQALQQSAGCIDENQNKRAPPLVTEEFFEKNLLLRRYLFRAKVARTRARAARGLHNHLGRKSGEIDWSPKSELTRVVARRALWPLALSSAASLVGARV